MDFAKLFQDFYFRIGLVILFLCLFIYGQGGKKRLRNSNFKGPVQKVWYDAAGFPIVIVNGKVHFLYDWRFNHEIREGDTIIKDKGDKRIKVIHRDSKDTLFFYDEGY